MERNTGWSCFDSSWLFAPLCFPFPGSSWESKADDCSSHSWFWIHFGSHGVWTESQRQIRRMPIVTKRLACRRFLQLDIRSKSRSKNYFPRVFGCMFSDQLTNQNHLYNGIRWGYTRYLRGTEWIPDRLDNNIDWDSQNKFRSFQRNQHCKYSPRLRQILWRMYCC